MKISVLIVDDESIAREGIRLRLNRMSDVEIVGECSNGLKAVSLVRQTKPNLVFLDIEMPGLNAFEVIEKIGVNDMPIVVFVTAYDSYAVRAFEVRAFDYLLKPFDEGRFLQVMQRIRNQLHHSENGSSSARFLGLLEDLKDRQQLMANTLKTVPNFLERIVVKVTGRIFFVNVEEVDWFEAADNYVKLHVKNEIHLVRNAISHLERNLDPRKFLRIRRSTIVNINRIRELQPLFHGAFAVILKDGTELISGPRFRKNFRVLFNE